MSSIYKGSITLADRLDHGYLTIEELCELKQVRRTKIYADIKSGALQIEKHGRSTRIAGPVAKEYRPGVHNVASDKAA